MTFSEVVKNVFEAFKQIAFKRIAVAVISLAFLASLGGLIWAEKWNLTNRAQIFGVVAIILFAIGIIILTPISELGNKQPPKNENERRLRAIQKRFDDWLYRLVVVTALGIVVVVLYSLQWLDDNCIAIVGVGLLASGGSWLVGLVVGFLFGIPHLTGTNQGSGQTSTPVAQAASQIRYVPSTSLEQVADWLTKIIVGVGLTQINKIPGQLGSLATFIGIGMGNASSHKVFALWIVIYFVCCGFVFGFLWARLYMEEAFAFASWVRSFLQGFGQSEGGDGSQIEKQPLGSDVTSQNV